MFNQISVKSLKVWILKSDWKSIKIMKKLILNQINLYKFVFSYAMDGLSADKLRVLLHPVAPEETDKKALISSTTANPDDQDKFHEKELNFGDNLALATLSDGTRGLWKTAQVMYSYPLQHKVTFLQTFNDRIWFGKVPLAPAYDLILLRSPN